MKKTLSLLGGIVILLAVAVGLYVLRPSAEQSAPVEAPAIATQEMAATEAGTTKENNVENSAGEAVAVLFGIVSEESEARFTLNEMLRGNPKTVVGATNQVAGEILFDLGDLSGAVLGEIVVNARGLKTDNDFRNRAVANAILQTGTYENITFKPVKITGLPASVEVGDVVTFQVTGDLTIRDVTMSETFDLTVTVVSGERLEGLGSAMVAYADYGIAIPDAPGVAEVDEEVLLEIAFAAVKK